LHDPEEIPMSFSDCEKTLNQFAAVLTLHQPSLDIGLHHFSILKPSKYKPIEEFITKILHPSEDNNLSSKDEFLHDPNPTGILA
jgi:hypothetical protein